MTKHKLNFGGKTQEDYTTILRESLHLTTMQGVHDFVNSLEVDVPSTEFLKETLKSILLSIIISSNRNDVVNSNFINDHFLHGVALTYWDLSSFRNCLLQFFKMRKK